MNTLKWIILNAAGILCLGRLARAMNTGSIAPLRDQPLWLIGWIVRTAPGHGAPKPFLQLAAECRAEIAYRRRIEHLLDTLANDPLAGEDKG